jgi:hypothetical protein
MATRKRCRAEELGPDPVRIQVRITIVRQHLQQCRSVSPTRDLHAGTEAGEMESIGGKTLPRQPARVRGVRCRDTWVGCVSSLYDPAPVEEEPDVG